MSEAAVHRVARGESGRSLMEIASMGYQKLGRFVPAMAVALLLTSGPLIAAEEGEETGASSAEESQATEGESTTGSAGTAAGQEAVDIVGRDVLDQENERIGKVTNVLIGPEGRVDAVILSTGGVLGLGGSDYEVPWDQIAMSPDGQDVMVGVAKDDVDTEFSAFEAEEKPESEGTEEPAVTEEPESGSETLE